MQIEKVVISNYRSLQNVELGLSALTGLLGSNNVGKSTILKAIELFFDPSPRISREDLTVGNEGSPIEITITFASLTAAEAKEFGNAVLQGKLTVTRQLALDDKDSGQYSVTAAAFPRFNDIRSEGNGTKKLASYRSLQKEMPDLPAVKTAAEIEGALAEWEVRHVDKLEPQKIRGFFGATNVANGKLRKKTAVHIVAAVRDAAAETADPKRSPIIALLSDIAKQTFENKKEIAGFLDRVKNEFEGLADPEKIPQLSGISGQLTKSLKRFYEDSKLEAQWIKGQGINVEYPSPKLVIDHGGITSDLSRVGHGLQRAALFSIVQFLAEQRAANTSEEAQEEFDAAASDIILLIEEPEIYQHPSKQLVIFDAFKDVTAGHNRATGVRIQVVYTTHSEKFVRMSAFDVMRLIRRSQIEAGIKNSVAGLTIGDCSKAMASLMEPPVTPMPDEAFIAKLHIFGREVCEGFFAERVVLVEGVTDKAVLEASYRIRKRDPNREGTAIVAVDGKTKMDKPAYIFSSLGIPTFLVFDNDSKKKGDKQNRALNRRLQKICSIDNPVDMPVGCAARFAAMDNDLETYFQDRLGDSYESLMRPVAEEFGLSFDDIKKTPAAVEQVFMRATSAGVKFPLLQDILDMVDGKK